MPPRIARSSTAVAAPKNAKNKSRKRQLDAFAIAGHEAPEKLKIRQHRLGESLGDGPRQKRRRLEDDDEDSEGEERIDSARMRQERGVTKRTGGGAKGGLDNEDMEYGSDSEGNEWTVGGIGEDASDSDIDSDEAFGESDEEKFEGFTFRGSSGGNAKKEKKKAKAKKSRDLEDEDDDMDLNEDDEESESDEEEDDFGDEGVDLATMLDDEDEEILGSKDSTRKDMGEESAEDETLEEEDESEGSSDDDAEDDNDDERHARLQDFVEALDQKDSQTRAEDQDDDGGLTMDDLLAEVSLDKATLATLKPKRKSKAPQVLSAPLPKRQQDRIDRELATQKAKEQLDRWQDTVVQNRRAEFLSFPLKNPDDAAPIGKDKFVPVQQSKPRTELEENIQRIMEESGMVSKPDGKGGVEDGERELLQAEELATNKLPVEEMLRRRAELRRARELLFREEHKAKRIAKIKSKAYRRVHRKERERNAEKERALLDPEGLGILDEDEQETADRRRAEARMGAKHKDSKWAKSLKATDRAAWDDNARDSVIEQARRQEQLRKRIAGRDVSDDEASDAFSEDDDDEDQDSVDGDAATLRQLKKLGKSSAPGPHKGVGAMKFMRDADDRRKAQNKEATEQLRREMGGEVSDDEEIDDDGLGRAIFGPRPKESEKPVVKPKKPVLEEGDATDEDEPTVDSAANEAPTAAAKTEKKQAKKVEKTKGASGPLAKGVSRDRRAPESEPEHQGDWLVGPTKKSKMDKKLARQADSQMAIDTNIATQAKPTTKGSKSQRQKANVDDTAEANGATAGNTEGWTKVTYDQAGSDDSDVEPENPMLNAADKNASFHARAFAVDDVQLAFDNEKADAAASEDEKEVSTHMPGWGSWTGSSLSKSTRKANARARHNPLFKNKLPGTRPQDRKDAKLENVIVSEKQDRKGKKYLAPVLPHQFERKEEYERSLRLPLGPEWQTKEVFQRNTKPRVVTGPGKVIEAMERPRL